MAANSLSRDYYIYVYFRPDGSPCYIGKGRGGRWKQHLRCSHNRRLQHIITKAGGDIPHLKLHVGLTHEQAAAYEVALIAAIGRAPGGPLVNVSAGGEGNLDPSAEVRARMSAAHRGKVRSAETRARIKAAQANRSPEWRAKIAAASRGRAASAEARAKMSAVRLGKKMPPRSAEVRANMSAARRGRKLSPEHVAKLRATNTGGSTRRMPSRRYAHGIQAELRRMKLAPN